MGLFSRRYGAVANKEVVPFLSSNTDYDSAEEQVLGGLAADPVGNCIKFCTGWLVELSSFE